MAYCPKCGAKSVPGDVYCPFCGYALGVSKTAAQTEVLTDYTEIKYHLPNEAEGKNELSRAEARNKLLEFEAEIERELSAESDSSETLLKPIQLIEQPNFLLEIKGEEKGSFSNEKFQIADVAPTDETELKADPINKDISDENPLHTEEISALNNVASPADSFQPESLFKPENNNQPGTLFESESDSSSENKIESDKVDAEKESAQPSAQNFDLSSENDEEISQNLIEVNERSEKTFDNDDDKHRDVISENFAAEDEVLPVSKDDLAENINENKDEPNGATQENLKIGGTAGANAGKSATLNPLQDGTILGKRYSIVRRIGGGGMGAVYMAEDRNLNNANRAVKEMIQAYVDDAQQQKAIADFKRESMMLSTLEHPSIPTIYDYFFDEEKQRFYLVMKYISGGDLAARLRSTPDGRLEERFVCETAAQIADVLDYLHNQPKPIIYRDLKPSNVMIDGTSGRAMLIDFGIARSVNKEEKGVTAVGTMGYAPPELFSGNAEPRTDIYSLGATMFHLLTGADPQNNPLLIFDFSKNPRPRQLNPSLSNEIEKILLRAVEYNTESRFSSAAEMRNVLVEHLERLRLGKESYGDSSRQPLSNAASANAVPMVFCGFCGEKIAANVVYCVYCGSRQLEAERFINRQPDKTAFPNHLSDNFGAYSASRVTARLVLISTTELNPPIFNLDKPNILIGRRDPHSNIFPEVDLTRFDPTTKVSRRHARIWQDSEGYLIEDLGSSNGTTILDGGTGQTFKLVPNQPHLLAEGDRLRVGETTLHFSSNR